MKRRRPNLAATVGTVDLLHHQMENPIAKEQFQSLFGLLLRPLLRMAGGGFEGNLLTKHLLSDGADAVQMILLWTPQRQL